MANCPDCNRPNIVSGEPCWWCKLPITTEIYEKAKKKEETMKIVRPEVEMPSINLSPPNEDLLLANHNYIGEECVLHQGIIHGYDYDLCWIDDAPYMFKNGKWNRLHIDKDIIEQKAKVNDPEVYIEGLRITGSGTNLVFEIRGDVGDWVQLNKITSFTLEYKVNEIPSLTIKRYVGV